MSSNTTNLKKLREEYKKDGLAIIQYDLNEVHSYPYDTPWISDKKFTTVYDSIRNNTLVDRTRCYSHYLLMNQIRDIPGDILEVGVWRGGTAGIFTQLCPNKQVYLADTFTGVVKSSEWEHYVDEAHSDTSMELVVDFLDNSIGVQNYTILKGIFPEDTGSEVEDKKFAYVHIDVDVYQSAKDTFNYIWHKLSIGGIVTFDDYGFISACPGISKLVEELSGDTDKLIVQNLNGQAYIIKRGNPQE